MGERSKSMAGPTLLCLSRQTLPKLAKSSSQKTAFGAYEVTDCTNPDVILVATGSEVALAMDAAAALAPMQVRVVSMPSCELFRSQPREYREALLPSAIPKMSVEMTTTFAWMEFVDACVGITSLLVAVSMKDADDLFSTWLCHAMLCRTGLPVS